MECKIESRSKSKRAINLEESIKSGIRRDRYLKSSGRFRTRSNIPLVIPFVGYTHTPSAANDRASRVTTDVDFNCAMSTDREANNPYASRCPRERQLCTSLSSVPLSLFLLQNPFTTRVQTLILFPIKSIEPNEAELAFAQLLLTRSKITTENQSKRECI